MFRRILIGYFKNSQGEGNIRIASEIFGLIEFHRIFLNLSNGLDSYNFSQLPFLDEKFRIDLIAYNDTRNIGLKLTDNGTYEWRVTKEKWGEFRHNLIMMCERPTKKPIHFESNSADKNDLDVFFYLDEFNQFYK